jgi:PadR family transcriptional regulator PadR
MSKGRYLGELEQLVLLAVLRLGRGGASGMTVRRELEERARRSVTIGSVYGTLERLEEKGMLGSWRGEPDPVRGGKARRYFRVEPAGVAALRDVREQSERMWEGIELAADGGESS